MVTPWYKNPSSWDHEIYNFIKPFTGYQNYILNLFDQCPGEKKKILKEIMNFNYMTYMLTA